jgi:hypothetical protein
MPQKLTWRSRHFHLIQSLVHIRSSPEAVAGGAVLSTHSSCCLLNLLKGTENSMVSISAPRKTWQRVMHSWMVVRNQEAMVPKLAWKSSSANSNRALQAGLFNTFDSILLVQSFLPIPQCPLALEWHITLPAILHSQS